MLDFYKEARTLHEKGKYEEALKFYEQGIAAGDEKCWFGYAILLRNGYAIEKDYDKAMDILRVHYDEILKLANSHDAEAMRIVASYHFNGFIFEKNEQCASGWLKLSAQQGNASAQCSLGLMYQLGLGIDRDLSEAFKWYRLAAEQGHTFAQFNVGSMYANGKGVEQDYTETLKWYMLAAEQGSVSAQYSLGSMYDIGKGVKQDYTEALRWYMLAAEQGSARAQNNLGSMYANGKGVKQDYVEALKWCTLAAEQGNVLAQFNVGLMYYEGHGVERNYTEALKWYTLAAERGNALAQLNLGVMYYEGHAVEQNYTEALKWYTLAAEHSNASAQVNLGSMYFFGKGVERDYKKAFHWYTLAAEYGLASAQGALGGMYADGYGIEQNYEFAKYWLEKSAANKNSYGLCNLGYLYRHGLGVDQSFEIAANYWKQACESAEDICNTAPYYLAYAYYDGLGVKRDLNKSKYYFELAIENGYQCSYALEMVKRELGEESKDNLMHEYAESIVKKHISNDKLYVRISKDLEKDFGAAWHTMDKESKNFLISGLSTYIIYYSMGAQIYGNLDFSQSIMEMCKALERELGKYLYSGYVEYLKKEKIDPKIFNPKRSFIKKVTATEYDYYSSDDVKKFTLGNLEDTLGIERFMQPMIADDMGIVKSNKYELKIDETMASYLDRLFKLDAFSSENRNREIQHYIISLCQEVKSIADSFRNPSAHTNIMKYHRAEVCGNYIIKVKKLLRNFIDKIDVDQLKK